MPALGRLAFRLDRMTSSPGDPIQTAPSGNKGPPTSQERFTPGSGVWGHLLAGMQAECLSQGAWRDVCPLTRPCRNRGAGAYTIGYYFVTEGALDVFTKIADRHGEL